MAEEHRAECISHDGGYWVDNNWVRHSKCDCGVEGRIEITTLKKQLKDLREALDATAVILRVALKRHKAGDEVGALEYFLTAHTEARAGLEE